MCAHIQMYECRGQCRVKLALAFFHEDMVHVGDIC